MNKQERDETIRVGDLVMVVKPTPCCGNTSTVGDVFIVQWIGIGEGDCNHCGALTPPSLCADADTDDDGNCYNISQLKKINPPPVEQSTNTRQEVTA